MHRKAELIVDVLPMERPMHRKAELIVDEMIHIYIYIYIPLFCPVRVLMVDIFIIFRVHQVKLQKVPLNGNINKKGGVPGCPEG